MREVIINDKVFLAIWGSKAASKSWLGFVLFASMVAVPLAAALAVALVAVPLAAQTSGRPDVPTPPPQPSRSVVSNPQAEQAEEIRPDPTFPKIELAETPLDVPAALQGDGEVSLHARELYHKMVLEAYTGYFGSVLQLYNLDSIAGNDNGNTREGDWNNLYNFLVGLEFSGDIKRFRYDAWFAMPLNLGEDTIQLRNYEFGLEGVSNRSNNDKNANNDLSYRGTFQSKLSFMLLGGFQLGFDLLPRKSARLILGAGAEGMLAEWNISAGNYRINLLAGTFLDQGGNYSGESLKLFAGQLLPFVYLQGGAFLQSYLEIFASIGYSPATFWLAEEARLQDVPATLYRRYGYLGQTILGEFQARFWIGRRFALKLGLKGRITLKTIGNLRTYTVDSSGKPQDPNQFSLIPSGAGMSNMQVSAFLGFGLALDRELPPGKDYAMPF